ncbi:MAG TPA: thymidine phosphorylase [Gaiellaceae bacterium]|nr:thymidine phosphorylase [Gaiellaceae bacterium]
MAIRVAELIERKRNGEELSDGEISELVLGYTRGDVPDYQMAAWCMAVYFKGLSGRETHALTDAMISSGETLDLGAALGRRVVDKHSTGGVGDKTSLAVGPIVAACGVPFGKMSGRGLGHTGGTLDKLESIPGYRAELTIDEFVAQVRDVGLAIIGQTGDLVPADKKLYALRDVTATVDIVPLIASSIMSKKLAAGADAIVLDVKVGDGAFMKTLDDARILAEQMVDLGRRAGREVVCLLTDMDQPLGHAVGNALEVREAVETISAEGPPDLSDLVLDACARLLVLSDLGVGLDDARQRAEQATTDGSAREMYERWIRAQGGDPELDALPRAPVIREVLAPRDGIVTRLAALEIGVASLELGGGRRTKDDEIDHAVGVVCSAKRGQTIAAGQVLADVHARDDESAARAVEAVLSAYTIGDESPPVHGILLDIVA